MPYSGEDLVDSLRNDDHLLTRTILDDPNIHEIVEHNYGGGWNALHWSSICETPRDVYQSLLESSTKAPLAQDKKGRTPLRLAIENSSEERIIMAIEACPWAASISDDQGDLPLHDTIFMNKSPDIIKHLLIADPSATMIANHNGSTPLDFFFLKWNARLRMTLESMSEEDFLDGEVKGQYTPKKKTLREVYQITILLLQAAVYDAIEENPSPLQLLHAAIVTEQCPWAFFQMILKVCGPPQDSEGGSHLLHVACSVAKSSSDGELYSCNQCKIKFCTNSWYKHHLMHHCRYCISCFEQKEENEEEYTLVSSVDKISTIIQDLVASNPNIASLPDNNEKLPLNLAIEHNQSYQNGGARSIFKAAPDALSTRDIQTHLFPFMLAAVQGTENDKKNEKASKEFLSKFGTCFDLMMENPVLVSRGIPLKGVKRNWKEKEDEGKKK